jgi:NAD(P)-dependent dehydrogenase (short-subunit alcohol dehydrogenase family)
VGGYAATKAALDMVSDVARLELAPKGVLVSVVHPSVTATEFHQRLRAGAMAHGAWAITPDPPELAAAAILFAVETGAAHVLVDDPPRALDQVVRPAIGPR